MLEIEMKFPAANLTQLERTLQEWGGQPQAPLDEADHYFNAPDRDFAQTDEALRVRRVGAANFVTYKGPRQPGPAKVRTEIELPLTEGERTAEQFVQLLTHLGYRLVAVVRKRRQIYQLNRDGLAMAACLDRVENLGDFAELEIVAAEERLEAARDVLRRAAAALGLDNPERRSYLELLLEKQHASAKGTS